MLFRGMPATSTIPSHYASLPFPTHTHTFTTAASSLHIILTNPFLCHYATLSTAPATPHFHTHTASVDSSFPSYYASHTPSPNRLIILHERSIPFTLSSPTLITQVLRTDLRMLMRPCRHPYIQVYISLLNLIT